MIDIKKQIVSKKKNKAGVRDELIEELQKSDKNEGRIQMKNEREEEEVRIERLAINTKTLKDRWEKVMKMLPSLIQKLKVLRKNHKNLYKRERESKKLREKEENAELELKSNHIKTRKLID